MADEDAALLDEDAPVQYESYKIMAEYTEQAWISKALDSPCAANIDEVLASKGEEIVAQLKQHMFEQLYQIIGREIEPMDLQRALVVKNQKFHPWVACVLTFMTFGIFHIFRPRDDSTILVLTKQGRVYALKVQRPTMWAQGYFTVIFRFTRYMILVLFIVSVPSLIYFVCGPQVAEQLNQVDAEVYRKVKKSAMLCGVLFAGFAVLAGFWLYSNWPQDYSQRVRQSQAANAVAAVQFCLTGSRRRREATLRLFFGKYPTQATLDAGGLANGCIAGPIDRSVLVTAQANKKLTPAFLTVVTLVITFVTILDSGFSWYDRAMVAAHYATIREFCVQAPRHEDVGLDYCKPSKCQDFALDRNMGDLFCRGVKWYSDVKAHEDQYQCGFYGHLPPCCSGCTSSETTDRIRHGWFELMRAVAEMIGDVGTIIFSLMVARVAVATETATDSIDVVIKRTARHVKQTSNFDLSQPLALQFVQSVFKQAWGEDSPAPEPMEEDSNNQLVESEVAAGIKNFIEDEEHMDWEDFFYENSIAIIKPGELALSGSKVNIPRKCLGMSGDEKVVGAWIEIPVMLLADLLPHMAISAMLFTAILLWPTKTFFDVKGEMGTGMIRLIAGLFGAICYFLFAAATQYFFLFRMVEHAVIMTNLRVFYVRHKRKCLRCLGSDLRVDIFRHDSQVFYGRMENSALPLYYKLLGVQWLPGITYMQVKFGVLGLTRNNGDALQIYHVISHLSATEGKDFLSQESLEKAGVDWTSCQRDVRRMLKQRQGGVWDIEKQDDDICFQTPDIAMHGENEFPVFHWSFKDVMLLQSPYHMNTDIIVTTDRVFLWNRPIYKPFDCKTACCYGMCWCACFNKLIQGTRLPNMMSFFTINVLLSFATEVSVDPPLWTDPNNTPLTVPCFKETCDALTRCLTMKGCSFDCSNCSCCPARVGARKQMYMMFRLRYNAQQDDLIATIKPYRAALDNDEEAGFFESLGCDCTDLGLCDTFAQEFEGVPHSDTKKIATLRKIMAVAQEEATK